MPITVSWRRIVGGIVFCLLAGIGMVRIISTYKVFSQTTDEPAHLITGMEWLQRGTYTFEPLHPPLARVAIAMGPYLSGLRLTDQHGMWEEGNRMLFDGSYLHNLTLARFGVLPFFLLSTLLVWFWTRSRYGENAALLATLLIGGVGACQLWQIANKHHAGAALVLFLITWQLAASIHIHPDYLAYFNEFAGQHPERILVDSDLDWGQDLLRLSSALQQRHVDEVSIAYAGGAALDLTQFSLPRFKQLAPHQPTTGWVAISLLRLKAGGFGFPSDSFTWLNAYQPVCVVGRSIRLYYVADESFPQIGRRVSQPQTGDAQ